MAGEKELYKIPALDGGLVTAFSPHLLPQQKGFATVLKNIDLSFDGAPKKRPGTAEVLAPAGAVINGAHEYVKLSTGAVYKLIAHGTVVQRWKPDTSEWIDVRTGLTAGQEHDFLTFADQVVMVNGEDASALWDGNTLNTPTDFPICKYLAEYRLRIVAAGIKNNPSLLKLSHTGDPTLWNPDAAGSNATELFVSPDDGEGISGVLNTGDSGLLIGKPSALYGLFGYTRKDFVIELLDSSVGVASHKSMLYIRPYAYFVSSSGIFRYQMGGSVPQRISTHIQDRFESEVDIANLDKARALRWERYYVVSLPKVGGGTLTFAFHVDRERWVEWTQPQIGQVMTVSDDPDGYIYYTEPGGAQFYRITPGLLQDNGNAIASEIVTFDLDADLPEIEKEFLVLFVSMRVLENPYKFKLSYYTDRAGWVSLYPVEVTGTYRDRQVFRVVIKNPDSHFLKVKLKSDYIDQDFSPLAISYVYRPKEVL
jgi:hypothetical protein